MAEFPSTEVGMAQLSSRMQQGYGAYPAIFVHADLPGLQAAHVDYMGKYQTAYCYGAYEKMCAGDKEEALEALVTFMKEQLAQSEVDAANEPEMLRFIGWGPATPVTPQHAPGAPRAFEATHPSSDGSLTLDWKAPLTSDGGPVRLYVVERRVADASGTLGPWLQCGASVSAIAHLTGQPVRVRMEYRVYATNTAGDGPRSNVAEVML